MTIRTTATATALLCVLMSAMPAMAQTQSGGDKYETSPPSLNEPDQLQITPEKIEAFVTAAIALNQVRSAWKPKVDAAKTEAEAEQLRDAASAEMRKAVENSPGITAREYVAIARAAQQNPNLNDAIKERFDARRNQAQPKTQ